MTAAKFFQFVVGLVLALVLSLNVAHASGSDKDDSARPKGNSETLAVMNEITQAELDKFALFVRNQVEIKAREVEMVTQAAFVRGILAEAFGWPEEETSPVSYYIRFYMIRSKYMTPEQRDQADAYIDKAYAGDWVSRNLAVGMLSYFFNQHYDD